MHRKCQREISSLIRNCSINEGHTLAEVLEVARSASYEGEDAPNLVFYRQPIAVPNAPANALLRSIYWTDMAHWARGVGRLGNPSGAAAHLNELLTCNNTNRTFLQNRNVGQGDAYAGGENNQTLMASLSCEIKQGRNIAEVYTGLMEINAPFAAQGDTTLMQLSHLLLGPREGSGLGAAIFVRFVGEDAAGLAARLDAGGPRATGTPDDAPVENCSDLTLWSSHVIHWGL